MSSSTEIQPTAEGDLGRTPFAHLLVYAAEQQLTGALFLHVPGGAMHSVRLESGRPVKVQMGDGFARLGNLLVDAGLIDEAATTAARAVPGLIGESLVAEGHITRDALETMVERQFFIRMTLLFGLPPKTRYAYFADMHEIVDDGAPISTVHPLAVLWAGLREHAAASVMMEPVLERIGSAILRLHRSAAIDRLKPTVTERAVLDRLRQTPLSLQGLVEANLGDEAMIRWMVYGLVIMRFVDFGTEALPLFPEQPSAPPAPAGSVTLARIRLQPSAPRRFTAAAPDDVGDGERIKPQPRTRKRTRPTNPDGLTGGKSDPPQSSVAETTPQPPAVPKPAVDASSVAESIDGDAPPAMPTAPEGQPDAAHPAHALYCLAMQRLSEGDRKGALAACQLAREIDPNEPDYALLATWIRAILGGTNLESCVDDLDKLLQDRPDHVPALFYRGYLRRRIGDEAGAATDLRRVLELDPAHQDALRELNRLERRAPAKRPSGLYRS
ncbi:MAG: hypothetical protein IPM54_24240 [Polyangiaceae bacterium]|nr:hypothetical protein [Polyangiaceae bacterium]